MRFFVFPLALTMASVAHAQDVASATGAAVQLADRGPIFFAVPEGRVPAVDVRTTSIFRQRVSLHLVNTTIADALGAISRQSGLQFIYDRDALPTDARASINADQLTIASALNEVLLDTGLDVEVASGGFITLVRHGAASPASGRRQGTGTITGHVTDAALKTPLSAVSVRIEGSTLGTTADADGKYTIAGVAAGTYHVTARRVGYQPLSKDITVAPDQTATLDFALAAAPTRLEEVVTTAVGQQRRYEVGNDISTINADSIAPTAPITSLTDLISARAPGVVVEETGGLTGSGEAIRIRGQSSLILQGDPIVIVDGVRQDNAPGGSINPIFGSALPAPSRLNDLDFRDIQTIDVLKGPAASTEYGTNAANGVIVITTKRGAVGQPRWQASAEETASEIPVSFPTLYYSWGHTAGPSPAAVECPLVPPYGGAFGLPGQSNQSCLLDSVTTWDPLNNSYYSIFGTGNRQKYDLSVDGGSEAARYYVTGSVTNEVGVVRMPGAFMAEARAIDLPQSTFDPNGEGQRSVRATTTIRLGSTADLTINAAYLATDQTAPDGPYLDQGVFGSPSIRDSAHAYGYGFSSPLGSLGEPTRQTTDRVTGGLTGTWRPSGWFVGHGTVGLDHGSQQSSFALLPQVSQMVNGGPGDLAIGDATTDIYSVDLRGSATAILTSALRAVTSVGLQMVDTRTQGVATSASGITATNLTLNGAVGPTVTQLGNRQATLGGYGEETMNLSDRLFVTGAVRVDGASGFGSAYSVAAYPKASLSWLALDSGPTTLRVRGAFGESGVQPPNGAALQLVAPSIAQSESGAPVTAVAIANVQNETVKPERSEEFEAGADLGLWRDRMSVELTAYQKTTHDALVNTGAGWDAGGYPYVENVGEAQNRGLEGTLTAALLRGRAVTWEVTVNASRNQNKLITLAPGIPSQQFFGGFASYRFAPGYQLYGYWAPRYSYTDANHDGVIEASEVTVADSLSYVGSSLPTQEASFGTHVGLWGGAVSIGALVDYRGGFRLLNSSAMFEAFNAQSDAASNERSAPLWAQARDVVAGVIQGTGLAGYATPAGFYEDGTFVRFRELSLTYTAPSRVVRTLRLHNVAFTAAVRNLALWTRYGGPDPEVASSNGDNTQFNSTSNIATVNNNIREDLGAVPLLRYWVLRVNLGL